MPNSKTLMIQGTTSDAGKSFLVTAICRVLARKGIKVAPFKAQNMSLNSAVTVDGGEIGRAQAVQAQACNLEPITDMNPVLIKPNSDVDAQIIIHGKAVIDLNAKDYHAYKLKAMTAVLESHQRLVDQFDAIIAEGAGSPAEINLRENDIANMGFAEKVDCPVILIADIDRGGVFAHIVGTLELLSKSEQERIIGVVINRFRGDISLLQSGLDWLEKRINKPVIGVFPYLMNLHLEAEDAIEVAQVSPSTDAIKVIVPVFPRISNHTDFDVLRLHPQVDLRFVKLNQVIPNADIIILPGTKNVRSDLASLLAHGWDKTIAKHLRYGGKLIGICGGFQMLGKQIHDPLGIESKPGSSTALGLLDFESLLEKQKQLKCVQGNLKLNPSEEPALVSGYEIHNGTSQGVALNKPLICLIDENNIPKNSGVISEDNQIIGSYLHGLFDSSAATNQILKWAGLEQVESIDYKQRTEFDLELIADNCEKYLNWDIILEALKLKK